MASDKESWSLEAFGSEGDVTLDLHESSSSRRTLTLSVGTFYADIEVPSPDVVAQLQAFLTETFRTGRHLDPEVAPGLFRYADTPVLELGSAGGVPIRIRKDGKYDDRYFIQVGPDARISFAPSVEQTERLVSAVKALFDDLRSP